MLKAISPIAGLCFALLLACAQRDGVPESESEGLFVFVQIPEPLKPLERGAKYEDPLNETLTSQGLGEVSGGGTALGPEKPNGTQDIEYVAIDVDLKNAKGLPVLRSVLKQLGAPKGTTLQYELNGVSINEPL